MRNVRFDELELMLMAMFEQPTLKDTIQVLTEVQPLVAGDAEMSVKVLKTNDTWYGMTYHEDVAAVKDSFKKMLENGAYKADLFSDL